MDENKLFLRWWYAVDTHTENQRITILVVKCGKKFNSIVSFEKGVL